MDIELLRDIDVDVDVKLTDYFDIFDLDTDKLQEYIILLKLNKVKGLRQRKIITELLFPEIYQDFENKICVGKILELIYDTNKGIPNLIDFPLKSIDNFEKGKDREVYDYQSETWKKIDENFLKDELVKFFIGTPEEQPVYNHENIKKILYKIVKEYVDRQYVINQKSELLMNSFLEDQLYREYISDTLGISIDEITETWSNYRPDKWSKNHLNITDIGKIGILPSFIRDYLNSIDNQNENMLYLRYGSIGDGDCLFHSYLDMTSQEYLSKNTTREKQTITKNFRKWLSDNAKLFDYNYLNPQISYFLFENGYSDEVSYKGYKKHLKNCSEYGYDLDYIYLMNIFDYKRLNLIHQLTEKIKNKEDNIDKLRKEIREIKKDKKYNSYNIFLFSYDLNRINIDNHEDKQEFGKQFVQLLPHYTYQSDRDSILLFNVGGMHFEGIIRIPLPKNKLTFTNWKLKHRSNSSSVINSSSYKKKSKNTKNTQKKNTLFNGYFDNRYLLTHFYPQYDYSATQYTNRDSIIQHLITYIKSSGEQTESWESHPIRNWKDDIYYLCEKDGYSREEGFRIPDNRGICPINHPWRFKMGNSDNFCCSKSKKIAEQKLKLLGKDNNYKDALGNQLPILQKITSHDIFNNQEQQKKTKKNMVEQQQKKTKKNIINTSINYKGWNYYKDRSWVIKLVDMGIIKEDGSNFEIVEEIYQNRPKGVLKTNNDVVAYVLDNINLNNSIVNSKEEEEEDSEEEAEEEEAEEEDDEEEENEEEEDDEEEENEEEEDDEEEENEEEAEEEEEDGEEEAEEAEEDNSGSNFNILRWENSIDFNKWNVKYINGNGMEVPYLYDIIINIDLVINQIRPTFMIQLVDYKDDMKIIKLILGNIKSMFNISSLEDENCPIKFILINQGILVFPKQSLIGKKKYLELDSLLKKYVDSNNTDQISLGKLLGYPCPGELFSKNKRKGYCLLIGESENNCALLCMVCSTVKGIENTENYLQEVIDYYNHKRETMKNWNKLPNLYVDTSSMGPLE